MKKLKGNFTIIPNEYITDENLDCYININIMKHCNQPHNRGAFSFILPNDVTSLCIFGISLTSKKGTMHKSEQGKNNSWALYQNYSLFKYFCHIEFFFLYGVKSFKKNNWLVIVFNHIHLLLFLLCQSSEIYKMCCKIHKCVL